MSLCMIVTHKGESFEEGRSQESRLQHLRQEVTHVLEK